MYLKTPLLKSRVISDLVSSGHHNQTNVYLKLENIQPSGSFKMRGLSNSILKKIKEGFSLFFCSSGGNGGLAAAYVCMQLNVQLNLYVPETTGDDVVFNLKLMGANVKKHGKIWDEADEEARKVCKLTDGACYVHPFDDPLVWEGHTSIIDEIKEQLNGIQPDCIIASVGGGGLMCGLIEGLIKNNWLDAKIDVIAVETSGADCFHQAVKSNQHVTLSDVTSIAKTLAAKKCAKQLFDYYQQFRDNIKSLVVSDKQAVDACLKFLDHHKFLVEVACGASLAVAYNTKELLTKDYKNIVVIVCGGTGNNLNELLFYKNKFNL